MADIIPASLVVKIAAQTAEFTKGLARTEGQLTKFSSKVSGVAKAAIAAFSIQQLGSFTFEIAKLAGEAEGVRAAFERLPESQRLMLDLKDATAGTVSELDLMKRTVQASNFGIALESLPELLKFASIRAQQTGQSVDYLVDSIITGIGRKSPLILDNLGISAVRLKEQFNGASLEAQNIGDVAKAVGRIAGEELQKMGDFSENTSTKVARLNASWENLKVTLGSKIGNSDLLNDLVNFSNDLFGGDSDPFRTFENGLRILNESGLEGERYAKALESVTKRAKALGISLISLTDSATGLNKILIDPRSKPKFVEPQAIKEQVVTLESLQLKLKDLNEQFEDTNENDRKKLSNIGQEIRATQNLIAELEKYRQKQLESKKDPNISFGDISLSKVASEFNKVQDSIKKASEEIGRFITEFNKVNKLPETININAGLKAQIEQVKSTIKNGGYEIQEAALEISGLVANGIAGIADALGEAIGTGSFANFGKAVLDTIAQFAQQLGGLMVTMGLAEIALKGAPGPAKVAAGIALIAAAAAVRSHLSKQSKLNTTAGTGGAGGGGAGGVGQYGGRYGVGQEANKIDLSLRFESLDGRTIQTVLDNYNNYQRPRLG